MNPLRISVVLLFVGFVALYLRNPKNPRVAVVYARWVLLALASALILSPFVWLVAASFKDASVFNEYVFFPPLSEWSAKTVNLGSFKRLLAGDPSIQGKVYFWQYVLNSLFVASGTTMLQVVLCSCARQRTAN